MNDLQKVQMRIAREIKRICDKNSINYFLDAGSLLGAVRHNGFIPWDDDMDFGMIKEDYDKFIKVAAVELNDDFFLDNYYTNSQNPYVFSKVRLKGTTYIESIGNADLCHNEIFVDVFPYYYISDNEIIRKFEGMVMLILSQTILYKSGYKVWKDKGWKKRIKFFPIKLISIFFTIKALRKIIDTLYSKHIHTKRMCIHSGSCYGYWYFYEETLTLLENHVFENDFFKIPSDFDTFLKKAYGDYMILPKKSERQTHQIWKLDFGNIEIE